MSTHRATLARQSIRGRALGSVTVNQLAARRAARGDEMTTLDSEVQMLRKAWAEKAVPLRMALAALEQDDGKPAAWRTKERARLVGELAAIRQHIAQAADEWATGVSVQAAALRGAEPVLDAAAETAALRDQLRMERLSHSFKTQRDATADLVPRAQAALALGNIREARVLVGAAELAGAFGLDQVRIPLNAALDKLLPNRAEALALEAQGAALHQAILADVSGDAAATNETSRRVAILAGDLGAAQSSMAKWAATSASAKVREYASRPEVLANANGGETAEAQS